MRFPKLFEPIRIGSIAIKNRIGMAAINNGSQTDPLQGTMTQRLVDYYIERAKGGVGLIITGVFKVENEIERCMTLDEGIIKWPLISKKSLHEYAELASCVHAYGAKIFFQLSAGPGRVTTADVINSGVIPVSASENDCFFVPSVKCRPLETEEVERIVAAFGKAAQIVAMAGMDGVEVHGHEGYLLDQFTTALWNRRSDKYGGNLTNRLRFPIEILGVIREKTRADFPVIYRYGVKHFIKGSLDTRLDCSGKELGRDIEESVEIAKLLEKAGYDALDVDAGVYESAYWAHPPYYFPHGFSLELVQKVKEAVKIPILAAGRLGDATVAEKALEQGKVDVILLGRSLLADPEWPNKTFEGRLEDIRPCIACEEGCRYRVHTTGASLSCSVNPTCNREKSLIAAAAIQRKRIWIVGGGVAGMEAARVASLRGHDVTLFEATDKLGGHLNEASVPKFKGDIRALLDWYRRQIGKSKLDIRLGVRVSKELIKREKVDTLIVATGSRPHLPKIAGVDNEIVGENCDVLLGKKPVGDRVVIIGGGMDGCETALWLTDQGKQVAILEMLPEVATGIIWSHRTMILDLLASRKIEVMKHTAVQQVTDDGVVMKGEDAKERSILCDTVVLATGMKPDRDLYESLVGEGIQVYSIGDCNRPRKIHDAIWEGSVVGHNV